MSEEQRNKADRYAQAILEAVLERWQTALSEVSDALSQKPDVRATLERATANEEEKSEALQQIMPQEASQEMQNFLKLLAQEEDLDLIPSITNALRASVAGQAEPTKAEVVSAVELDEEERADLQRRLTEQHGEGLIFSFRVDPSVMGGLRVRIGDTLLDNTVASRLAAMRELINSSVR